MSKKVLPNRVSKTIPANALDRVHGAVEVIRQVLGEAVPISEADYKSLRKIAAKLKQETDEVFALAQANPELTEAPFTVTEMSKDKSFYEFCDTVYGLLQSVLLQVEREQNIAGAEYANSSSLFEEHVALKSERGHPKAQNVQLQLNRIERYRPSSAPKSAPPKKNP
jgi:hypothetical protein